MSGAGDRPRRQGDTRSLFVRIPHAQADKLDRAAFELGAHKQDLIAGLVDRYVDPSSPTALSRLGGLGFGSGGTRRVTVETDDSSLTVGRASFLPAEPREVLTLAELAELLQLDEEKLAALAAAGELPGRRLGEEWRFSRSAILDWLAGGSGREPSDPSEAAEEEGG